MIASSLFCSMAKYFNTFILKNTLNAMFHELLIAEEYLETKKVIE